MYYGTGLGGPATGKYNLKTMQQRPRRPDTYQHQQENIAIKRTGMFFTLNVNIINKFSTGHSDCMTYP
jgi:hypothetical protein